MPYTIEEIIQLGARPTFEFLVQAAANEQIVNYADVSRHIAKERGARFKNSWHHIGNVAGHLMEMIWGIEPDAPPLNAIVTRNYRFPGIGADPFIDQYLSDHYPALRRSPKLIMETLCHDVWSFQGWAEIGHRLFGRKIIAPTRLMERDGKAMRAGFGGPAESKEHYELKAFVSMHPTLFGASSKSAANMEYQLDSGDEVDVLFVQSNQKLAIEVKSRKSSDLDRRRGIFQCVKYRAVLKAQASEFKRTGLVKATLVSEVPLTPEQAALARKLKVRVKIHKIK